MAGTAEAEVGTHTESAIYGIVPIGHTVCTRQAAITGRWLFPILRDDGQACNRALIAAELILEELAAGERPDICPASQASFLHLRFARFCALESGPG